MLLRIHHPYITPPPHSLYLLIATAINKYMIYVVANETRRPMPQSAANAFNPARHARPLGCAWLRALRAASRGFERAASCADLMVSEREMSLSSLRSGFLRSPRGEPKGNGLTLRVFVKFSGVHLMLYWQYK